MSEVADGHACGVAVDEGGDVWVARPHDDAAPNSAVAAALASTTVRRRQRGPGSRVSPWPSTSLCAVYVRSLAGQKCRKWRV